MNNELSAYLKIFVKLSILVGGLLFFDWMLYPRLITIIYDNLSANQYCFKQKADVLVLGDSHTQRSINPNFTDLFDVYNFSKTGNYLPINYAIYAAYREFNPAPKYVVLSMEPWSFRDKPFLGNYFLVPNKSHGSRYIEESMLEPKNYFSRLKEFKLNVIENAGFTTEFLLRLISRSLLKKEKECITGKSYVLDRNLSNRDNNIADIKRPGHFKVTDYDHSFSPFSEHNKINLKYFKLLIDQLAQDGVRLVLLESPRFIGASDSIGNVLQFYHDIERIIKNYNNVFFLKNNFFKINHADPYIFYDGSWGNPNSHLNGKGAAIFNEQFFQWLNKVHN